MVAISNPTSSVMDRLGRWRPTKRRHPRFCRCGGIPSRDSGYFAITPSPSNATAVSSYCTFYSTLLDNPSFVHTNPARRQIQLVEIAVIVRDHHDGRAGFHQIRQQFVVEFAPEFRILFGRPFVKQEDRTLFEQADDERESPALAARKIERAKLAVRSGPSLSSSRNCLSRRSTSPGSASGTP